MQAVTLPGARVHAVTLAQVLAYIAQAVAGDAQRVLAYANVHTLNLAHDDAWFRAYLAQCDVVYCDGFGVKWAADLLGTPLPARFTPPDWLGQLAAQAATQQHRLYLLGGQPGAAAALAAQWQQHHPALPIVGTHHGYFDQTPGSDDNRALLAAINAAAPAILLVGMGTPRQERWLQAHRAALSARVLLPVGAAIDLLAGVTPRGPAWMTDHGLEWLTRLAVEPRRLWRRYLLGNPRFVWRVLRYRRQQARQRTA